MKCLENECVNCVDVGLSCMGSCCPNRSVLRFYCDMCGYETELYYYDGEELCIECIEKKLEKVEG